MCLTDSYEERLFINSPESIKTEKFKKYGSKHEAILGML